MPIVGSRGLTPRSYGFGGAGKPNAPTINSVTRASNTSVTITYTLGANNGAPILTIGFVSSPSIALTFTNTDLDGTITVTGSFASNTAYTFTMTATNAAGTSSSSSASNSVTPLNTFTVNYLVIAGGGGAGGNTGGGGGAGGYRTSYGTSGRNSSAEASLSLTGGTTYSVTVGGGGVGGATATPIFPTNGSNSTFSTKIGRAHV